MGDRDGVRVFRKANGMSMPESNTGKIAETRIGEKVEGRVLEIDCPQSRVSWFLHPGSPSIFPQQGFGDFNTIRMVKKKQAV